MTAKQFFKSTAFKCVVTLLCILLVCGIFLTLVYEPWLKIPASERKQRAINKIYGYEMAVTQIELPEEGTSFATATILESNLDADGNYLIKSKGTGGYAGTVTCWVLVVLKDGAVDRVGKVVIESSDGETQLGSINHLDKFPNTQYTEGFEYTTQNGFVTSSSTLSSTAINNAVNGAVKFVNEEYLGKEDPYAAYAFKDFINFDETEWSVASGEITYTIKTKDNGPAHAFTVNIVVDAEKKIKSYTIPEGGYGSTDNGYQGVSKDDYNAKINVSLYIGKDINYFKSVIGENGEVTGNTNFEANGILTGATRSNYLCLYAGAFAVANYDLILNPPAGEGGAAQ